MIKLPRTPNAKSIIRKFTTEEQKPARALAFVILVKWKCDALWTALFFFVCNPVNKSRLMAEWPIWSLYTQESRNSSIAHYQLQLVQLPSASALAMQPMTCMNNQSLNKYPTGLITTTMHCFTLLQWVIMQSTRHNNQVQVNENFSKCYP